MAPEVFISYSMPDKAKADAVCLTLEQRGFSCWIAPRDVPAGSQYGAQITKAIRACQAFLLVFSNAANSSPSVQKELEQADRYQRVIVPFRVEDVPMNDNIEYYLGGVQWIDDSVDDPSSERLVDAVRVAVVDHTDFIRSGETETVGGQTEDGSPGADAPKPVTMFLGMSKAVTGVVVSIVVVAVFLLVWFLVPKGGTGSAGTSSPEISAGALDAFTKPMVTGASVALKSDGTVWAWGSNEAGQLGNGTVVTSMTPVQVSGLSSVIAISSCGGLMATFSLALKDDGTVWAWGNSDFGGLGDASTTTSDVPIQITKLKNITAIAAGDVLSLAIDKDGTVWAWGGIFGTKGMSAPSRVDGLANATAIAANNDSALVLKDDGTVWALGSNQNGELGDGTTIDSATPVQVQDLADVVAITIGLDFSVALKSDGTVWAWGANSSGQLGNEPRRDSSLPIQVKSLSDITTISAGNESVLAIDRNGSVWAWGDNTFRQLGIGASNMDISTPMPVSGLTDTVSVAMGFGTAFAVKSDGTVWAWGTNASGSLGTGNTSDAELPVQVLGEGGAGSLMLGSMLPTDSINSASPATVGTSLAAFETAPMMATGVGLSLALKSDGTVWAWGDNGYGSYGNGTDDQVYSFNELISPAQVGSLTQVTAISVAAWTELALALKSDGTVWAWGDNGSGGLGQSTLDNSTIPIQVPGLTDITAVAAGSSYYLALKDDGTVWTWGDISTELGPGVMTTDGAPIQVPGLTGITSIAVGDVFALALSADGTVWAWGDNGAGQLGNGTKTASHVPVQVAKLDNVVAISASPGDMPWAVAVKQDGTVWTWGGGYAGTLGNGAQKDSAVPVQVQNLMNITAIATGAYYSLALSGDGTVWGWGQNLDGQLGNGSTSLAVPLPVQVANLSDVTTIAAGSASMALTSDGMLWAWGSNFDGVLGTGSRTDDSSSMPAQVIGEHGVGYLCLT